MTLSEGTWRFLDSAIKGVGATAISGLLLYFGSQADRDNTAMLEEMRIHGDKVIRQMDLDRDKMIQRTERITAAVEFSASQKNVDIDVAKTMLSSLVSRLLDQPESSKANSVSENDLLLLRMIALNFQDVPINLKPIYDALDQRLRRDNDGSMRNRLHSIAKEVANRQAYRMTILGGEDSGKITVREQQKNIKPLKTTEISVNIGSIDEEKVDISLYRGDKFVASFGVGYVDMPMVDNLKISRNSRVAVILLSTRGKEADLRFLLFNYDLATDRFDIKELSREFYAGG